MGAVVAVLLGAWVAAPALGERQDDRDREILAYVRTQQQAFAALTDPDEAASREFAKKLEVAADVAGSMACDGAEAEALLALGEFHLEHRRDEEAGTAFRRALTPARRSGDWQREIRALQGTLALLLPNAAEVARETFSEALAAYVDVSVANDRLLDSLDWLERLQKRTRAATRARDKMLIGMVVNGLDAIAYARIVGETDGVPGILEKFHDAGLHLLAGKMGEEFEEVVALDKVLLVHRHRGDARSEARVGALLLKHLKDGKDPAELRRRTFDAAVRADDHVRCVELAPTEETRTAYRRLMASSSTEPEAAPRSRPRWQRDGRSPDTPDAFLDAITKGLGPDGDWTATSDLIEFAHVDGSHAFVPLFLHLLSHGSPHVRSRAASAIGELATISDVPRLLRELDSEHWDVRRQIAMTLATMVGEDGTISDALKKRLDAEEGGPVRAALHWGLVRAGETGYLQELGEALRSGNKRTAATASIALYDLGFMSAVPVLHRNSRPDLDTRPAEDTSMLLGYASRPEAVFFLERYVHDGTSTTRSNAVRSLNRFDTPRARRIRKTHFKPSEGRYSSDWLWWGLRDARRGRMDVDEMTGLVHEEVTKFLDHNFLDAEVLGWIIGEYSGAVDFQFVVRDNEPEAPLRRALRGLEGRRTDDLWAERGSGVTRRVDLRYRGKHEAAVLHVDLEPVALLVDPTRLTVDFHRRQRHAGVNIDIAGAWWMKDALPGEARDALREIRLEGVGGLPGPLVGKGAHTATFEIPASVTPQALRHADLVLRFKFFSAEKTVRFPLAAILHVGAEIAPDLVPIYLDINPPTPRPSAPCVVLLDVVNAGHARASTCEAVFYVTNRLQHPGRREIGRIQVPPLDVGESVQLALGTQVSADVYLSDYTPGWTPDDQDTAIEVDLDAQGQVPESDEDNNRRTRPVAFILTDDERAARSQGTVLSRLNELAATLQGLGPDAGSQAMRVLLDQMLEELGAVRPRTPGLKKARRYLRMLGAQIEARDRIRDVMPRILDYDPATGTGKEAAALLGELLRAQADLLRSGVPVAAKQVARIEDNLEAYRDAFGEGRDVLDKDQREAIQRAAKHVRLADGAREIFGPVLDPVSRRAATAFLERNQRWNGDGIALASDTLAQAIGSEGRGFAPADMEEIRSRWKAWSKPPKETREHAETIFRENGGSDAGAAADKTSRSLLKRLGL